MALADFQAACQQLMQRFDPSVDVSPGSRFDTQVIQPLLFRVGPDPFSMDTLTFIKSRMQQAFPEIASSPGITDLFFKPLTLLLEPIVRENEKVKRGLSMGDPSTLTLEEADALGANFFSQREKGNVARGLARIYFAQPVSQTITPVNYLTARSNVRYFPTKSQSISADEMVSNFEDNLYYMDVNAQAENAGNEYNIGPNELIAVAGIGAAVRVTNKRRFRFGAPEQDAFDYINQLRQEITEKSLVTAPGARAIITGSYPEVQRMAVVGHGDVEMRRDIIEGGGLGPIIESGVNAATIYDQEGTPLSRRIYVTDLGIDFTSLIGPVGEVTSNFYLTIVNAFGATNPPFVRDIKIKHVWSESIIDLEEKVLIPNLSGLTWALRRKELTLSNIPGGILYPNTSQGEITIQDNEVHVGGMSDIFIKGTDVDTKTLVLTAVSDEEPVLLGNTLQIVSSDGDIQLSDYVLGTNYQENDEVYEAIQNAYNKNYSVHIQNGPTGVPGAYRIIAVAQTLGNPPSMTLSPAPVQVSGNYRWKIVDILDVSLHEPRDMKLKGSDANTSKGSATITFTSGMDLTSFGVGSGDIIRITAGNNKGDYTIKQVIAPFLSTLLVDRQLQETSTNQTFEIFTANPDGAFFLPLLRVNSLELLDSSTQPIGSEIPYAKIVDCQSFAFSNPARGIKVEAKDVTLGLVSTTSASNLINSDVDGLTLEFTYESGPTVYTFEFNPAGAPSDPYTISQLCDDLNAFFGAIIAFPLTFSSDPALTASAFGIAPKNGVDVSLTGGTARNLLFGSASFVGSTKDIRSSQVGSAGGWETNLRIDELYDVVHVVQGSQMGFYGSPTVDVDQLDRLIVDHRFFPELQRYVRVGARSIGKARCYFLNPTSVSFTSETRFDVELADGTSLGFIPDSRMSYTLFPFQPNGAKPKDGEVLISTNYMSTTSVDFIELGVVPGDLCVIDYQKVLGSVELDDPVQNIAGLNIIITMDNKPDRRVVFTNDSITIPSTDVTRDGVISQINAQAGIAVASLSTDNKLQFDTTFNITVRAVGSANTILGLSTSSDTNNNSPLKGTYEIIGVLADSISFDLTDLPGSVFPVGATEQQFSILRRGLQRVPSTAMANNLAEVGLYYADVELVSEGTGDVYNIPEKLQLVPSGYLSDGYWLTTESEITSFSDSENVVLHTTKTILEVGVNDDPSSATQLSGQNMQLTYETSSLVTAVQSFINAEEQRIACENSISRHLIPHYVRVDFQYRNGPLVDALRLEFEDYTNNLSPEETFQSSKLINIAQGLGATSVNSPFTMVALIYQQDRTIWAERSSKALGLSNRLSAFLPDVFALTRSTGLFFCFDYRYPVDFIGVSDIQRHTCVWIKTMSAVFTG